MSNDNPTASAVQMARITSDLHNMAQAVDRLARTLEASENRIRSLELTIVQLQALTSKMEELLASSKETEAYIQRQSAVTKLLYIVATLPAGMWFWLSRGGK